MDDAPPTSQPHLPDRPPDDETASPQNYTTHETAAAMLEVERRRLASLLQKTIIESLNLMLAQTRTYQQALRTNAQAHMVASVLGNLVQQTLQQARDLEASLHPALLEALGLEPALDALAAQFTRSHGLQVALALERLPERLPATVELALFRVAQDALERMVYHAGAARATIRLSQQDNNIHFTINDDGRQPGGRELLQRSLERTRQLGGTAEFTASSHGSLTLSIHFVLMPVSQLTPREMDVLRLLAKGLSNKQIASTLSISPRTVNFHLDNLYTKLGINSRTEAVIHAIRHGWLK